MALQFTRTASFDEADALTLEEMLALGLLAPIGGAEGDDDDSSDDDTSGDSSSDDDASDDSDDSSSDDDSDEDKPAAKTEVDWRKMARKHEREAKKLRAEKERLAKEATERADADKTEQQKAIDKAKEDAKAELQEAHDKERRQDRLEAASARIAGKGVTVGEGDKAKTLKFADPEDALVYLERDINAGKLDAEDLFDASGKVKADALEEALTDLLERKPHLAADAKKSKVKGSADTGKGEPTDAEGSVDDHLKKVRRVRPDAAPLVQIGRRAQ